MIAEPHSGIHRQARAGRERRRLSAERALPYLLITPAALVISGVFAYPALDNAWLSLWSWKFTAPQRGIFVGLGNYVELFTHNALFRQALGFTLLYTVVTLAVSLVLGLTSALVLHPVTISRRLLVGLLLLPYMISPVAAGLGWGLVWGREFGLANYLLGTVFGIEPVAWLAEPAMAGVALMTTEIWRSVPFVTLVLLGGLAAIPVELSEAARLDGASVWQELRRITLPLLLPSLSVVIIFETIFKLRVFDLIVALTGGGPGTSTHSLGLVLYRLYFRYFEGGTAAAVGMVLLLLGGLFAVLYLKLVPAEGRA
ncbi:MAG TPA: sugar ABC transporter permease [Methylomirabilota bacterium]|nr:sugar ABC transporter permease [Methylomirabilota bacterium]